MVISMEKKQVPKPYKQMSKKKLWLQTQELKQRLHALSKVMEQMNQGQKNALLAIQGHLAEVEGARIFVIGSDKPRKKHVEFIKLLRKIIQGVEIKKKLVTCSSCPAVVTVADMPISDDQGVFCEQCIQYINSIASAIHIIPDELLSPIEEKWDLDLVGKLSQANLKELDTQLQALLKKLEGKD